MEYQSGCSSQPALGKPSGNSKHERLVEGRSHWPGTERNASPQSLRSQSGGWSSAGKFSLHLVDSSRPSISGTTTARPQIGESTELGAAQDSQNWVHILAGQLQARCPHARLGPASIVMKSGLMFTAACKIGFPSNRKAETLPATEA